jgi:drug/metabolite transporter (DMT)-like permease
MKPIQASGLLLLAAICWGLGNVAQKTVLDAVGPFTSVGVRCLLGSLVILPVVFMEWRAPSAAGQIAARSNALLTGIVLSFAGAVIFYQMSFATTTVTNAGFLVNTCSALTPLVAWILFRAVPPPLIFPAVLLSLTGIFLMGGAQFEAMRWGDVCASIAALLYAIWAVLSGVHLARHTRPFGLIFLTMSSAGCLCLVLAATFESMNLATLQAALPELLFLGVVTTGIPYAIQIFAQQHVSATTAMILVSSEAVFGAVLANLWLGETLTLTGWLGAFCVLCGISLAAFPDSMIHLRRLPAGNA